MMAIHLRRMQWNDIVYACNRFKPTALPCRSVWNNQQTKSARSDNWLIALRTFLRLCHKFLASNDTRTSVSGWPFAIPSFAQWFMDNYHQYLCMHSLLCMFERECIVKTPKENERAVRRSGCLCLCLCPWSWLRLTKTELCLQFSGACSEFSRCFNRKIKMRRVCMYIPKDRITYLV